MRPGRLLGGVRAYGLAVLTVAAAVGITWVVPAFRDRTPFLLVLGAAFVSSAHGGFGPGLFATFAGALATDYLLVPPLWSAIFDEGDLLRLGLCLALGITTSWLSAALRDAAVRQRDLVRRAEDARAAAEAASRAKDEFLALVSHELRSPLAAIRSWVAVMRSAPLDADRRALALRSIDEATVLEARLVGDLLDVSRIVSGKLRIEFERTDLADAARAAADTVRDEAGRKGIRLDVALAPAPVWGDPARLRQVAANLLVNAVKFTPDHGHVTLRLEQVEGAACLTVADDGPGIAPEELPHVFERFRQGEQAAAGLGGLGLGLAIVRHLVEAHGGTVCASSAGRGAGATFVVTLPLRAPAAVSIVPGAPSARRAGACP